MSAAVKTLAALQQSLACIVGERMHACASFTFGADMIDSELESGLACGAVHEFFAASEADSGSTLGFALAVAQRAAGKKPCVWVRQSYCASSTGRLYPDGFACLGFDPNQLLTITLRKAVDVLRVAHDALRCLGVGAVILEPLGKPKAFDLTATRRLSLAAEHFSIPLLCIHVGAQPSASAAQTRWQVQCAPSSAPHQKLLGHPAFNVTLTRSRLGKTGQWTLEWNSHERTFVDVPPLLKPMVQPAPYRQTVAAIESIRHTGT